MWNLIVQDCLTNSNPDSSPSLLYFLYTKTHPLQVWPPLCIHHVSFSTPNFTLQPLKVMFRVIIQLIFSFFATCWSIVLYDYIPKETIRFGKLSKHLNTGRIHRGSQALWIHSKVLILTGEKPCSNKHPPTPLVGRSKTINYLTTLCLHIKC